MLAVTHDGSFHADEVFAIAALGLRAEADCRARASGIATGWYGCGLAEVVSLGVVDAELAQELERRLVLDAYADGGFPEADGHLDYGLDGYAVSSVAGDLFDELAVDLERVEREVFGSRRIRIRIRNGRARSCSRRRRVGG